METLGDERRNALFGFRNRRISKATRSLWYVASEDQAA
jgi:hypothetical protein